MNGKCRIKVPLTEFISQSWLAKLFFFPMAFIMLFSCVCPKVTRFVGPLNKFECQSANFLDLKDYFLYRFQYISLLGGHEDLLFILKCSLTDNCITRAGERGRERGCQTSEICKPC